jgi:hypothetical protein
MQGDVHFNLSNGLRTADKSIVYQYRPTDTPEDPPCSSQIPQSRQLNSYHLASIPSIPYIISTYNLITAWIRIQMSFDRLSLGEAREFGRISRPLSLCRFI